MIFLLELAHPSSDHALLRTKSKFKDLEGIWNPKENLITLTLSEWQFLYTGVSDVLIIDLSIVRNV